MKRLSFIAGCAFVLLAANAGAHGIGESAAGRSTLEYVPLGIEHMLLGWDHLLFIAGVVLLAGELGRAAKLISLFVAGHSLTLIVATLAGWQLDATLVDVVIALSVAYVGVQGLHGRPADWRAVGVVVFGFGLIHGLGLSTRLQDLGIPDDGLLGKVIAFNVGVELGQLWALIIIFGLGILARRLIADRERWTRPAFAVLMATGLIAAAVLSFPGSEQRSQTELLSEASGCTERAAEPPPFSPGAGHPAKPFYGPDEAVPEQDLSHVIGDGYIVVRYSSALGSEQVRKLSRWLDSAGGLAVVAPHDRAEPELEATTATTTLICERLDTDVLAAFNERWKAELVRQRTQSAG